jgi:hypothetical protein
MKRLLAVALVAPVTSWAQSPLPSHAGQPQVPTLQHALSNAANPRLLSIPTGRFMYRHLPDTVGSHYARPLPAGDWSLDIIRFVSPRWLAVRWKSGTTKFTADTTTYYIHRDGVRVIVLL